MGMMINRRRVIGYKKGLLPSGYKQVEYIENTSNAYIETDYYGTYGDELEIVYKSNHTDTNFVIGWGDGNYKNYIAGVYNGLYAAFLPDSVQVAYNRDYLNLSLNVQSKHTYLYKVVNNVPLILVDGVIKYKGRATGASPDLHQRLDIFTCKAWPTYANIYAKGQCYSFMIKRNNKALYHFIPCISPNNIVGLYDIVNHKFYSSPNGIAFVAGPEV